MIQRLELQPTVPMKVLTKDNVTVYNVATLLNKNDLIKQIGPGEYVCTCHASATCAHVVAVQMHLQCFDHDTKKPRNSTLALKRARKPADKTSGRKRPRKKDVDPPSLSNKLTPKGVIYTEAADKLLNGQEKEVFEHMLGSQPDENENTDLAKRAVLDKSLEDFSNMAAEKSNDGDRPGFSDEEEEELRLTISNALANTTTEESIDLQK
ncbi:Uncharacterized protein APZ42_012583 [Daphnia magna]|uniref:SWIM-type domain-containing protein n=1 Tax=Daphnia magna TaxID=35525 RepID=A0A162RN95_9CRUS|nr:Uncharacterized protein APZ42_012583 [Daphnia magna]